MDSAFDVMASGPSPRLGSSPNPSPFASTGMDSSPMLMSDGIGIYNDPMVNPPRSPVVPSASPAHEVLGDYGTQSVQPKTFNERMDLAMAKTQRDFDKAHSAVKSASIDINGRSIPIWQIIVILLLICFVCWIGFCLCRGFYHYFTQDDPNQPNNVVINNETSVTIEETNNISWDNRTETNESDSHSSSHSSSTSSSNIEAEASQGGTVEFFNNVQYYPTKKFYNQPHNLLMKRHKNRISWTDNA